ncbi:MAG TPA: molybdate ABC transporter substrate-binding protein [Actinomycetota bacterium]|nr:molybdate ABC transporter substrate-binding protein [Actinomycetota bacterium]
MKIRSAGFLLAVVLLLAGGCGRSENPALEGTPPGSATELSGSATIFAAASLTESFDELAAMFEEENPSAGVVFNFSSSSSLAAQISEQGGADAFASADQANMQKVTDQGLADGEPRIFARNKLEIIVGSGNPKGIRGLTDLDRPGLKVVLAAPEVPAGRYAREALSKAGVTVTPVSEALDVKGVVGPVTLGEADAGIVYTSDIVTIGARGEGVPIPDDLNVVAEYPIVLIDDAENAEVARAFVDLVLSEEGRAVLIGNGFLAP